MGYHKENLKTQLVEIAWEICSVESWQKVNMRRVASKAGVSNTAFYRHFKNKNDLKAELMLRGFQIVYGGMKDLTNNFSSYGAHYIRFGVEYPHIYDLMFECTDINMSLYPDLETLSDASFSGIVEGLKSFMTDRVRERCHDKSIQCLGICAWHSRNFETIEIAGKANPKSRMD